MARIGIVTTWFERGAAYVSKQYMNALNKKHQVFIYARGGERYAKGHSEWDIENVHWGRLAPFQINSTPINRSDFERWIKNNNIDIIFFNEQQWWPPVYWAKKLGKIVGSYIDYYTEETIPFFKAFDFLVCNTQRHSQAFKWHPSCHYIPWGTDVNIFKPASKRSIDNEKLVFFNSAGFNPERKGVYELLRAFYQLKEHDDIKLIIHTQVDLKKYYANLACQVDEMLQKGSLEIISETVTAPGLYHLADVYCYLSKLDGIGLTLPEAVSSGLQAIVPDNAPMNEFVNENTGKLVKISRYYSRKDGYYWPQCEIDEEDLLKAMKFFIDNKNEIATLKEKARQFALKNLDWSSNEEIICDVFSNSTRGQYIKEDYKSIIKFELKKTKLIDLISGPYRNFKRIQVKN